VDLYTIPSGAVIGGVVLNEQAICPACHVTIGDAQHGPEIFTNWSADELAAIGIYGFVEDVVPPFYIPGDAVDIMEPTDENPVRIHRTYPNQYEDTDAVINAALEAITAKYDGKRAALKADMLTAMVVDGPNIETNLAALRTKWDTLANSESEEILALFM